MLGNDIVDLTHDITKHLNQKFVHRTMTHNEQQQLVQAKDKNVLLWSLWAVKEASYKACQKLDNQLLFSPCQFELIPSCLQQLAEHNTITPFHGSVQHNNTTLHIQLTWQTPSTGKIASPAIAVHATAIINNIPMSLVQIRLAQVNGISSYKSQSAEVRNLADSLLISNGIKAQIQRPTLKVKDYTKLGPPILVSNEQKVLPHEISLSHDNEWLAVALLLK